MVMHNSMQLQFPPNLVENFRIYPEIEYVLKFDYKDGTEENLISNALLNTIISVKKWW